MNPTGSKSVAARVHDLGGIESLYQVRLLSALRSGDPALIHPFITEISRNGRKTSDGEIDVGAAALHLAIRCASCDTVALLLSHRSISPNAIHPPGSGITPLHLSASLARIDAVSLLLEQEGIDDTIRDSQGRSCLEVAKGKDTIRAIKDSRAFLTASYRSLLRTYILSPPSTQPPDALLALLSSPRIRLVDLSYIDDGSGKTLLHEAAKRKDLRLVELSVRAGADVFVRDRRGKMVYDGFPKDDRVRVFLRQFTNQNNSLIDIPSSEPPELKGYLNKYTNVAKGYNTRWFVLVNGMLSYYRHQDDENIASRGMIAMRTAIIKTTPGSGGLRFEVHSTPTRGNHGAQKWYIKANHPVEASRWITALNKSIEFSKHEDDRKSVDSQASHIPPSTRGSMSTPSLFSRKKFDSGMDTSSITASTFTGYESDTSAQKQAGSDGDMPDEKQHHFEHEEEQTSVTDSADNAPPHNGLALHGNSTVAQLELVTQLIASSPLALDDTPRASEIRKALDESLATVHDMLNEYVQMVQDREEWWKARLEKETERQNLWEQSLQTVVREGEILETELRNKSRRRSRMTDSSLISVSETGTLKTTRPSMLVLPPQVAEEIVQSPETTPSVNVIRQPLSRQVTASLASPTPSTSTLTVIPRPYSLIMAPTTQANADGDIDTDEEDEFFDAIESNTLPNMLVSESLTNHGPSEVLATLNTAQYVGYSQLRQRLSITSDNRPPMSLWAVLKNSIGKDLTKISFPVFFNEPTSMLQRMAEDMEFSECLDAAAAETDPHRRIAFVAAFAMSNYSSTIGRIAKPFNPMLGETFEYVRFDKEYRYMSEQVSHHPPISACWSESPNWRYYGEVDAQNKFMGKSFEIRPTGIAHAELLLPEEIAPDYPKPRGTLLKPGKVAEHYSWKKVTTNISGFILGSPTIDHYGDMIVTNHRTNDQCILTFKPRGWRGRDAYEISGYVRDAAGTITYEIAGRWNSQLVARQVGTGVGHLNPDVAVRGASSPSPTPEFILLWRNSEKPPAPFNLTPFAITLNDCPQDTLRPYLCPTDCRLRPDQRAFELGKYEHANDLKNKQEDLQRVTRRAREEGLLPPHKPRWFTAETEPDTGERVWAPATLDNKLEYWVEREKVWKGNQSGTEPTWNEVDRIFIEDAP